MFEFIQNQYDDVMKINLIKINIVIIYLLLITTGIFAQQKEFGIRGGINQSRKEFTELRFYEIYMLTDFPINLIKEDSSSPLKISLETSAGLLQDDITNSAIFSSGPVFLLNTLQKNISLSGGISPSLMTKHKFKNLDLGGSFNFVSHIELMFSPIDKISLGYRFEHISNAGIYKNNPGVNMHFLQIKSIGWK